MITKKTSFAIILVSLIIVILAMMSLIYSHMFTDIKTKSEWMIVEDVEFKYRQESLEDHPFILTVGKYKVACILQDGTNQKIWILLNPNYKPYVKIMPPRNYSVKREVFNKLEGV